jgi:hypothetical protein
MRATKQGIALVAVVMAVAGVACGQTSSTAPAAAPASAPAGPPDISGVWGARFVQSLSEDPPFLPEALQSFNSLKPEEDPLAICKPPGIPRLMNLNFPMEILQTPKVTYFLMEYDQAVRRVYMDGKHPENPDPIWLGHSIGHWEGRTLIVDTVGYNDASWLDMRGHPHSDALHTIERFTVSDDGKNLQYEITIDDPKMYSKPWQSVTKTFPRRPDLQIQEFICET